MMTNIESNLHICKYIEPGGRGSCARVWSYSKNALFHKAGQEGVGGIYKFDDVYHIDCYCTCIKGL